MTFLRDLVPGPRLLYVLLCSASMTIHPGNTQQKMTNYLLHHIKHRYNIILCLLVLFQYTSIKKLTKPRTELRINKEEFKHHRNNWHRQLRGAWVLAPWSLHKYTNLAISTFIYLQWAVVVIVIVNLYSAFM